MSLTKNKYVIRSPRLKGKIVENILLVLSPKNLSFNDLYFEIQSRIPLSHIVVKKYLVYLIDFELVTYNGQRKVYVIEDGGFDLMDNMSNQKNPSAFGQDDITITLEREFRFYKLY